MKRFVYCSFQKEGYHSFPEAATSAEFITGDFLDVSHLSHRHMHYFFFKVWVEVSHNNRNIEFIQLRRKIEQLYSSNALELMNKSCEMLAEDLIDTLRGWYPNSDIKVDVSEEGINGALLEYCFSEP